MNFLEENILEPLLRYLRFKSALKFVDNKKPIRIADLGCGPKIRFFNFAIHNGINIEKYFGIDPLLEPQIVKKQKADSVIQFIKAPLNQRIQIKDSSVDYVFGLAFLEHIDNPKEIIQESIRILKKNGKIIFTTPTPRAKPLLEFLSFKLSIISRREIMEHKIYFDRESLIKMLPKKYQTKFEHHYFELGMNNLFIITKLE